MEIYKKIDEFASLDTVRFFMPGHKGGASFIKSYHAGIMPYDVTELPMTDDLFDPKDAILSSQRKLADYFGISSAHYLTGGATLGLYGALSLCKKSRRKSCVILDRGCHKSVIDALILLDMDPVFLDFDMKKSGIFPAVSLGSVSRALCENPDAAAVVITSPTYYGVMCDIQGIHSLTKDAGVPLIVDAAHGGNLLFLGELPLCAEFSVVSLHKTLPALTGSALLFSNAHTREDITRHLSLFSTSSPSFLILTSADWCVSFMRDEGRVMLSALLSACDDFRRYVCKNTRFRPIDASGNDMDPTRLVINTAHTNMSGYELFDALYKSYGVICEMADTENVVLIPSIATTADDFLKLKSAVSNISKDVKPAIYLREKRRYAAPKMAANLRRAFYADAENVLPQDSKGMISCEVKTVYPPGIPYLIPGQVIGELESAMLIENKEDVVLAVPAAYFENAAG